MLLPARCRWLVPGALVACAALLSVSGVRGQIGEDVLPSGGMDALNAEYRKHRELANDLLRGIKVADPKEQAHVEALDVQAKFVTYRFTWLPAQTAPGEINKLFQAFDADIGFLNKGRPGTSNAIQMYSAKVTERAMEVLKTRKPIARINAARVLAKLAELGQGELVDPLVEILKDASQSDAAKLYVLRALRDLTAQSPSVMTPARERKTADALVDFIDRKMTIADTTQPEEIEGFRYVRREAIRALAQFRNPSAADKGNSALTLLRVVAKDGFVPPPRIDERADAAFGVARLQPSLDKDYNPDYAVAQIALFLDDLNTRIAEDKRLLLETKGQQRFPWKVLASRLLMAVEQMRTESSANAYVVKVAAEIVKLLGRVEAGNLADPEALLQWLAGNPPPSNRLFKSIEGSTVQPANRKEGAELPAKLETKPPAEKPPMPKK